MSRPEHAAPPEFFYNDDEAVKYTANSRVTAIQTSMTDRALELLNLPPDQCCFLLDIGCGSGLSGECIEEAGHHWVGVDISSAMLRVALEREVEGDLFLQDIGDGFGFRPGTFDGAVSISVLQWLCNADRSDCEPKRRLLRFFSTLYTALTRGARAVFQFYPENSSQVDLIMSAAMKAGFTGGLVVDYPNSTKAKKYFLCLFAGYKGDAGATPTIPKGLLEGCDTDAVSYAGRLKDHRRRREKNVVKRKDYVLHKKELNRMRGKANVPADSKQKGPKLGWPSCSTDMIDEEDDIHQGCRAELQQKSNDIELAAKLGKSLLAEVDSLREQIRELEETSKHSDPSTPLRRPETKRPIKQPTSRLDPTLASSIDDTLVNHVRQLQHKLAVAESQRVELSDLCAEKEKIQLSMKRQISRLAITEAKLNERIWEMEGNHQQVVEAFEKREEELIRLKSVLRNLQIETSTQRELIESLRSSENTILTAHDQLCVKLDTEAHERRRLNAAHNREKGELLTQVRELNQELESYRTGKLRNSISHLPCSFHGKTEIVANEDFSVLSLSSHSSPSQPNQNSIYVASLSASLQHSHEQLGLLSAENAELRLNIAELQQLLADAQETIEFLKVKDNSQEPYHEGHHPTSELDISFLSSEMPYNGDSRFHPPSSPVEIAEKLWPESNLSRNGTTSSATYSDGATARVQMELVDAYKSLPGHTDSCSDSSQSSSIHASSSPLVYIADPDEDRVAAEDVDSTPRAIKSLTIADSRHASTNALSNSSTVVETIDHGERGSAGFVIYQDCNHNHLTQELDIDRNSCIAAIAPDSEAANLAVKRDLQDEFIEFDRISIQKAPSMNRQKVADRRIWSAKERPLSNASDTISIATGFDSANDLRGCFNALSASTPTSSLTQIPLFSNKPSHGFDLSGDGSSIEALAATMIGSWFQKYNRHGKKPKPRFFWVDPYNRLLKWAHAPLNQSRKRQPKSVYIEDVLWTELPENYKNYPPNEEHALTIRTDSRTIILVPTSWSDHHSWVTGLTLLLSKTNGPPGTTPLRRPSNFSHSPLSQRDWKGHDSDSSGNL